MDMDFDQLYYTIQKCDNNGVKCEPDIQALDNSSSRIIPWESTPIDFYHIPFLVILTSPYKVGYFRRVFEPMLMSSWRLSRNHFPGAKNSIPKWKIWARYDSNMGFQRYSALFYRCGATLYRCVSSPCIGYAEDTHRVVIDQLDHGPYRRCFARCC